MTEELLKNLGFCLLLLLVAAIVTDCSCGKTEYHAGTVQEHHYHPPYVTTSCSGKPVHCTTTLHSAEYHIHVLCPAIEYVADLNVGAYRYYSIRNGATLTVGVRRGRWTRHIWVDWLANATSKPDDHAAY